jgi:hypothetical protein
MDVRVEARPLMANCQLVESKITVETFIDVVILSPVVSSFSLAPVISVGGNSISAVNPEAFQRRVKAIA